jgi:hypothetical protein
VRLIRAGDEILNYYGPRPNAELLRQYGYVTQDHSRYDVVEIPWSLVEPTIQETLKLSNAAWKRVMAHVDADELEDGFVLERDAVPDVSSDGTFSGPAALREMPAELTAQIKDVLKATRKVDEKLVPDKRKRDDLVQKVLAQCVRKMVARYPTTIEEDVHRLAKGRLAPRHRMAIFVRLGEKQLLQEAIALLGPVDGGDGGGDVERRPNKKARR